MEDYTQIDECLACGGQDLTLTLDLQDQPLANSFQEHGGVRDTDQWFPLAINRCEDCNHLQLTHAVNPELIYTHYLYVSGTSNTYVEYMDWYARFVTEQFAKPMVGTVLDIGCNDGSQLDAFKKLGYKTFGVDPAENLYEKSSANHRIWCRFWDKETSDNIHTKFTVITTQNSFAHIPDPLAYLKLCREHLNNEGKIFISTSQADMVPNGEFDTIYHEHISYYNAESMRRLAERAGLYLIDVIKTPIHGTSYIFILAKQPANQERIQNILAVESALGLQTPETYTKWATGVQELIDQLKDQIDEYRGWGYTIVGYGAAAKGMTLINASNIHLDCVIDDNPLKQGLYCPGTSIPVVSIEWLDSITDPKERVVFVPLAWNFYTEIKKKILAKRNNAQDIFLRYFPTIVTETNED